MSRLGREARIKDKLREHGVSLGEAETTWDRVGGILSDEVSWFANLQQLLDSSTPTCKSLTYRSVLWPEFEFRAAADADGLLATAQYRHRNHPLPRVLSPEERPTWSVDTCEFTQLFGPPTGTLQMPFFHSLLPNYTELAFLFDGNRYGAGFMWGLLVQSSQYWPED